jgi:DNA-binding XRE family transcriptional regulator
MALANRPRGLGMFNLCVFLGFPSSSLFNASYMMHLCLDGMYCIIYDAFMLFEIGKHIRQERKKRKLSQAKLGELLGMSRTTIGQIENGTIQDVGVRKLIRILEILDLELRVRIASGRPTLEELRDEDDF